jgi:hypothetical protein
VSRGVSDFEDDVPVDLQTLYSDNKRFPPDELRDFMHTVMKARSEAGL